MSVMKNEMILHQMAIELMVELDTKYGMDNLLSLDEYYYEYRSVLQPQDLLKIHNLLNKFN